MNHNSKFIQFDYRFPDRDWEHEAVPSDLLLQAETYSFNPNTLFGINTDGPMLRYGVIEARPRLPSSHKQVYKLEHN